MASDGRPNTFTPHNDIELFINKLPPKIHAILFGSPPQSDNIAAAQRRTTLIADTSGALRVLQSKTGNFIRKGDSKPRRVALVVDYLCRHSCQTSSDGDNSSDCRYFRGTIPASVLMKLIGLKKRELEIFQNIVGNCLDEYFSGKKNRDNQNEGEKTRQLNRKREDVVGSSDTAPSRGKSVVLSPSTLIGELCIKLGSMVPDSEFVISYARSLFHYLNDPRILLSDPEMSTKRREFSLLGRDISDNKSYYEAVCFYLAVKKCEGSNESLHKRIAPKKSYENLKDPDEVYEYADAIDGKNFDDEDEVDNDAELTLGENDVINAANLLEGNFKTIIDLVHRVTQGVSIPLDFHTPQNLSASGDTEADRPKQKHIDEDRDKKPMHGKAASVDGRDDMTTENMSFDHAFAKWERRVLQDATYNALKKFMDDNSDFHDPDDETLLRLAANDVFEKFL